MKILIFVSGTSNSKSAVIYGSMLARRTNSTVTLFAVAEDKEGHEKANHVIEKAQTWIPDIKTNKSIRIGPKVACILDEANSNNYDLIVIKSRQAKQLDNFLASKTSRSVARRSPISVLVVKKAVSTIKRILICSGGLEIATPVIEFGTFLAKSTQARVTLLHVVSSIPSMYTGLDKVDEHLSDLLQTETPTGQHLRQAVKYFTEEKLDAQLLIRQGPVVDEILLEAQSGDYDLIAVGASMGPSSLGWWVYGDIAQKIVNQACCPVLVVHQTMGKQ